MGRQPLLLLLLLVAEGRWAGGEEQRGFTRSLYRATIPENSAPRRYVQPAEKMGVHVEDGRIQVRYKVVAGDKERQFKAESRLVGDFWLLLIRTRTESTATLNREYEDEYRLRVRGVVHWGEQRLPDVHCEVLVQVTDTNDLSPLFFPTAYNVTVAEDSPVHHVVARLSAYDPDLGVNGEIYYRLQEPSPHFAVHPTMGTVLLTRPLDFHTQPTHRLTVVAEDRGPKPQAGGVLKSSTAQVTVQVELVNRHTPAIFVRHVHALLQEPEVWAVVVVTDEDVGLPGTVGGLAIVDGDADDHFTVVPGAQPGEFSLRVDPRVPPNPRGYELTLRAWDRGTPPQFVDERVSLGPPGGSTVPQWEGPYEADVPEEAPPGTPLLRLSAGGTRLRYAIDSGDEEGHFVLNEATGQLSTARWLDHEAQANYSLVVSATAARSRRAVATVTVRVLDCNDHAPVFDPSPAEVSVEENRPAGSKVFTVRATDKDEAENGYVSYNLVNTNTVPFSVDPFSGEVCTTEVLDYETMRRSYTLRIRATDWGAPFQRQAEMALRVALKDINDHRPQFERVDCVAHGGPAGSQVLTLSAVDFDEGASVHYRMEETADSACFQLNSSTGVLALTCQLERPAQLNVTATDGHHFADVMAVRVLPAAESSRECKDAGILDQLRRQLELSERNNAPGTTQLDHGELTAASFLENRHSPELSAPVELSLNESLPVGSVVGQVQASDPDHGYNGRVLYAIASGDQHSCFRMDMHTGALSLVAPLDYELAPSHLLNVTAHDQGSPPRLSSQSVLVRVLDVNDNAPQFDKSSYSFFINENAPNGTSVARLRATDRDEGPNAELRFELDSELFGVDSRTGLLTVRGPLDRERQERHLLVVAVVDGCPEHPLSSTATVSITLRDVNDHAPQFAPGGPLLVRVREDLPVGTLVACVHAHDADRGDHGRVSYALLPPHEPLDVDPDTGLVRLAMPLDFEARRLHNVTVQARDGGQPPRSSVAVLLLEVEDVDENWHAPAFAQQVASASVEENQPPGTLVTTVAAADPDGVVYLLTGGTGLGLFTVDEAGGQVRTRATLDRETGAAHYWLEVVARDRAAVPREARLDLHVAVGDRNDGVPLSAQPAYEGAVREDAPPGTPVLALGEPRDLDSARVRMRLLNGSASPFALEGHSLVVVGPLDREAQPQHVLQLELSDDGRPALSSTSQLRVALLDVDDHPARFVQPLFRFRLPGGSPELGCQVLAVDPDGSAALRYSLAAEEGAAAFSVDPVTGLLRAPLVAGDAHELQVEASGGGQARVQLHAVSRPANASQRPLVHGVELSPTLETDPVGHLVAVVHASDPDGDLLWYTIAGGNEEGAFMVDCERGLVKVARPLDRETRASYNLTVQVTDGTASATTTVRVEVLDANDNWPRFSESLYEVEVSESVSPGTPILQLTASDADEDPRLSYALHNSDQAGSLALFALEAGTGRLRVARPLDREACERHLLTVGVRDAGRPEARWGFARVLVRVADHNDHPPEFPQARYEVRVSEAAAPGTALLALRAHDRDRGDNGRLAYAIARGNGGSAFSLESSDGVLRVARPLSHQGQPEFFLTVRATDHGEPQLNGTATVHVLVSLADDTPPRFESPDQVVEAAENQPPGAFLRALAVRSGSSVTFRLEGQPPGDLFRLDPLAGVLRTGPEPLDFERARTHMLTVRATSLAGAWALGRVEVRVLDRNDHAPRLRQPRLEGSVSEGAPAGSAVLAGGQPLVVGAEDPDAGANGRLAFGIREPWAQRLFRVDPHTGALSVAQPLDRELRAEYRLSVDVWDCGRPRLSAGQPALVTVRVSDVNDCPPRFERELYNASLLLPTYRGVLLARVQAHDADLEGPPLRYALLAGDHGGHFQVRAETGEVLVREPGGLEAGALHRLLVGASDGRSETATLVLVSVGRAGGGALRFARPLWEAAVRENEPGEQQRLLLVSVVGAALGEPLRFSLLTPSAHFALGARSGLLRCCLAGPLDREERALHELAIEARTARGAVAHARLRVRVLDANDNAPIFVGRPYYALLGVQARPGDLVLRPQAIDLDQGPNGRIAYALHRGDGRTFAVDERSGELRLRRPPAAPGEHALVLLARDHGSPPLVSYAGVVVKVLDRAAPSFGQPFYVAAVPEDAAPGTALLTLDARGAHPLVFHLSGGGDQFALEAATGVLSLVEPLDHESRPQHELVARATDSVTGAHSEVPLSVRVQDVNDCAPLFEQAWHNVSVSEAAPVGSAVLEVRVADRDGPGDPQLRLLGGDSLFWLEGSTVRLAAPLDREDRALHRLRLTAADTGGLSATARLWVTVLDMNDNPPAFERPPRDALLDSRAQPGQLVARVRAWDPDASDRLTYALLPGGGHPFAIDPAQGVVTLSAVPAVWAPSWELGLWVTDGAYRAEAQLRVSLVASNEHAPRFGQSLYDAVVAENLPAGAPVARVAAHDPDPLGAPLTYAIGDSPAAARLFTLDAATGSLVTREPLDRERQQTHEVPVWAEDGGGRRALALVRVAVADANDNEPVFGAPEYEASVWANTSVGTTLLQVRAFDPDQESRLRYSLHDASGNVSALFNVTPDSGELYLRAPLKGAGVFQFFVRASDGGLWAGALAAVTVAVVPEGPLPRLPAERDLFVREGAPLGSPVLALGPGVTVGGPPAAPFGVDAAGQLVVAAPLDRERQASHRLTLRAQAAGGLAVAHDVTVHVMDDNDCEPVFESPTYEATVAENEPAGCLVVRLAAHDPDSAGRRLTYEFYEEADPAADIFDIDPLSGAVMTRVALDREAVPFYNFSVRVRDEGLRSSAAWVHVRVLDVNDNPPVLELPAGTAQVAEDAVPGTVVARLGLADADREPAPVRYYLLAGDLGQQFAVGPGGDVFVQRALDREARPSYELTVAATDGLHLTSARLDVRLTDVNDNPPVCLKPQHTELVSEGLAVGTPVLTVEAADADEGPNAQLDFYLSGVGSEHFALDAGSGVLRTARPLDREQRDRYSLVAHVRDVSRWEWQCNTTVELLVSDVNDNPPVFGQDAYRVALPEDTPVGHLVAQPHATDRDLGPNRRLRYSLLGEAGGRFSVDGQSGLVRLEQPLERGQRFELTLEAQDAGTPPLAARVPLALLVQGGGTPAFTQQAYAVAVSEAAPPGSPVDAGVRALSRDGRVTYALVAGNERAHFSIEPATGVLRVSGPLDYEQVRGYQLAVEARDGGEPPLSARAWLNVTLLDANDNAPVFGGGSYSAAVREDAAPGHPVLQVQASDADSVGELRYSLLPPGGPFALHPATGQLSVAAALDHETVSRYVLEVECWDGGSPPLSARTQVRLEVVDVNEHAPQFDRANYTVAVPEGRPAGWAVLSWSLSDADGGAGGPPPRVELLGDAGGFFRLDGPELLRLARPLPPRSRHELRLRAQDGGRPPLAAEAPLTVLAVGPSRFPPELQPLSVSVRSFLDDFPGALVGRVRATDRDPHDRVRLSLLPGPHAPLFVLDAESGALRALPGLDAGHYALNVSAWDGGTAPVHGAVSVHVVAISEEALAGAAALRLGPTSPARFLGTHRRALLRALRTALGVRLRDLLLVSVQPAEEEEELEALVSVAGLPAATVSQRLGAQLEAEGGLRVRPLGDRCGSLRCVHGQCHHRLLLDPSDPVLLATEELTFVSPRHSRHAACLCTPGFGGEACESAVEECGQPPCPSGDERRPIWLGGHGYAHYVLARAPDRRLRFSARLRTRHPDGLLLHTAGPHDYALLEVSGGHVQFRLDCGGGEGVVRAAGRRVDDGAWHSVRLERRGRQARLWVDGGPEASGGAPGPHDSLDLAAADLHLGGSPATGGSGGGLVGCLDDARLDGRPLPLRPRGADAAPAQLRHLAGVHFGCRLPPPEEDPCRAQPCLQGATCRPLAAGGYACACPPHFRGARCELAEACAECAAGTSCPVQCSAASAGGGSNWWWPAVGGGLALLLLLLLLLTGLLAVAARRRRRRNPAPAKNCVLVTTNIRHKVSNLDPRPASYSTAGVRGEAPLNNFDTVRSYGSAADDLESRYQPNDLRCCLDKIPNDLKAALSPVAPSSAASIASDLPGYCWDYSDLAAHVEEASSDEEEEEGCPSDGPQADGEDRYTCHPDQYLPRHCEPAVCAIEDSEEEEP